LDFKRLAVVTSGGDASGMNAAVRSVVRGAISYELKVYGVKQGYKGLIENNFIPLHSESVSNIIQKGGTFLQSARSKEFLTEAGQKIAVENLKNKEIDGLIVIGGDGSLRGANILLKKYNIPTIGIPGSIDNDIYGTVRSIGVDTALNRIIEMVDIINDTASSHDRTFLVEVMGRKCGYLALMSAISSGAEAVLIPEVPFNVEKIIKRIKKRYEEGKTRSIIIVAEGVGSAYDFGKVFAMIGGFDTRITVLGHIQRGGSPTHFDRMLATRMGAEAVKGFLEDKAGTMTALQDSKINLVDLDTVLSKKKELDHDMVQLAEKLSR